MAYYVTGQINKMLTYKAKLVYIPLSCIYVPSKLLSYGFSYYTDGYIYVLYIGGQVIDAYSILCLVLTPQLKQFSHVLIY